MNKSSISILVFTLAFTVGRPLAEGFPARQAERIIVGPNVQVSAARHDIPHNNVMVAADPTDAKRLLAASLIQYTRDNDVQSIAYRSLDGGKSWTVARERRDEKFTGDPAVAYGPSGTAYLATLGALDVDIAHSRDGGKTWETPVKVEGNMDRPYLTVDSTGGKHRGTIYANAVLFADALGGTGGSRTSALGLFSSEDAGKTFSRPTYRVATPPFYLDGTDNSVVLSDGTLITLYHVMINRWQAQQQHDHPERLEVLQKEEAKGNAFLAIGRSTDGGRSFEKKMPFISHWHRTPQAGGDVRSPFAAIAADPGSTDFKDWLYVVWTDVQTDGDKVLFCLSKDRGLTWSAPIVLSEQPAGEASFDAFIPEIAVNKAGVIGVTWYDTREIPNHQPGWDVRFRASFDGGQTWLPSKRINEVSTVITPEMRRKSPREGIHFNGTGETAGLAADKEGIFHALWIDNRTAVRQIWATSVIAR